MDFDFHKSLRGTVDQAVGCGIATHCRKDESRCPEEVDRAEEVREGAHGLAQGVLRTDPK